MKTVIGLFDDFSAANAATEALVARNFNRNDISIAANNASGLQAAATADGGGDNAHSGERREAMQEAAKDGAGAGAVVGTGIGGTVGLLAGLGIIMIPGIGPIIAAGPLVATLTGAGIGAAAGGRGRRPRRGADPHRRARARRPLLTPSRCAAAVRC
jgi:hypothetical protein